MKADELRIGNIVCPINECSEIRIPTTSLPLQVTEVGIFKVKTVFLGEKYACCEHFERDIFNVSPIYLTKEWLLRFGFKASNSGEVYMLNGFHVFTCDNNEWKSFFRLSPYKYVHQLQNLYFALTGEELTIK